MRFVYIAAPLVVASICSCQTVTSSSLQAVETDSPTVETKAASSGVEEGYELTTGLPFPSLIQEMRAYCAKHFPAAQTIERVEGYADDRRCANLGVCVQPVTSHGYRFVEFNYDSWAAKSGTLPKGRYRAELVKRNGSKNCTQYDRFLAGLSDIELRRASLPDGECIALQQIDDFAARYVVMGGDKKSYNKNASSVSFSSLSVFDQVARRIVAEERSLAVRENLERGGVVYMCPNSTNDFSRRTLPPKI
mgnify:CR=1 FL=1